MINSKYWQRVVTSKYSYLIFISVLYILLSITLSFNLAPNNDDYVLGQKDVNIISAFGFTWDVYQSWGGRLTINYFTPLILQSNVWLWRILSAFFAILTFISLFKLMNLKIDDKQVKNNWVAALFIFSIFFSINSLVLYYGMFWATGSFNYAWPAACMLFGFTPLRKMIDGEETSFFKSLIYIPAILLAAYQEQTALVLCCFMIIVNLYYYKAYKRVSRSSIFLTLFTAVNTVILFTAKGNFVRSVAEIEVHNPIYKTLSMVEKLFFGYNYTVLRHEFIDNYVLLIMLAIFIIILIFKNSQNIYLKILAYVPLIYTLIGKVFDDKFILSNYQYQPSFAGVYYGFTATIVGTLVLLLIPFLIYKIFGWCKEFFLYFFIFAASICASFILTFSPTIYVSGDRIFYVGDILFILLLTVMLPAVLRAVNQAGIFFKSASVVIILAGSINYLEYIIR